VRVFVEATRRVGRVVPVRAEPSGVLPSRIEATVRDVWLWAELGFDGADATGAEASGAPQTLQ
jgi:hypothetical protein